MIVKTFFLVKIIHRIGARNLHDKKSLRKNLATYSRIFRISGKLRARAASQARAASKDRVSASDVVHATATMGTAQRENGVYVTVET
jgi:hypothetical protein